MMYILLLSKPPPPPPPQKKKMSNKNVELAKTKQIKSMNLHSYKHINQRQVSIGLPLQICKPNLHRGFYLDNLLKINSSVLSLHL